MKKIQRLIMVDDDLYSNMICNYMVSQVAGEIEILEFILPEEGIKYIESTYTEAANYCPTMLLLDINMPVMTGWDFLERYGKAENYIKNQFTIYLLSSSVDLRDKERAAANKDIRDFLIKPLTQEMVEIIFKETLVDKEFVF